MATKTQQIPQDNTGSSVLSQLPPSISPTTSVLASIIPLPQHPLIAYSTFTCVSATLDQLEVARRSVLLRNRGKSLTDSLLPCVNIGKESSVLYVFALGSTQRLCDAYQLLSKLELEGLTSTEFSSFTPASIYPCSASCSTRATPCENCLNPAVTTQAPNSIQSLPRASLRLPLTLFLQAVRDRLVDDIAEVSGSRSHGRSVTRLKGGFLLGPVPFSSEWGSGWENHTQSRPLIYCNLHVHISFSTQTPSIARLVVHPVMHPTYYLPLRCTLPAPAGTPIVLLPHGVPAYYLSTYHGPSVALTAQFEEALVGFGAGDWKRPINVQSPTSSTNQASPGYVVVWLAVQNKQGEDKGMPVIWPATLCVSYHATSPSAHARSSLPYIPELPAQLQASPPPPIATVPTTLSFTMAASSPVDIPASSTASTLNSALPSADREQLSSSFQRRPTLLRSSPTSDSLRAFRGLSLYKRPYYRDVRKVATEVSSYVDSVVKERERERERIRKERQEQEIAAARAKLASANPPADSPVPQSVNPEPPTSKQEEVGQSVSEVPSASAAVELDEPESHPSVESDHSVDSLFSPPDATIDLPSNEEEAQVAQEESVEDVPADTVRTSAGPVAAAESAPEAEATVPYDPFSWGQQSGYMNIDLFDMNIDSLGGARMGGAGAGSFDMDDGEPITEDDFAFFNSAPSLPPGASVLPAGVGLNGALGTATSLPSLGMAPLITMDGTLSGPGPPSASAIFPSAWPGHLGEAFTPRTSVDIHSFMEGIAPPELLPPSPTKTPSSYSAPATPSVHLDEVYQGLDGRKNSALMPGPTIFDPIPFAASHRETDGKYAVGKFALPSPPADIDRPEPPIMTQEPTAALLPGWKYKYSAVTDPRIGVVKKLIGVKRKSREQGVRAERRAPLWSSYREPEEWQSSSPPPADIESDESEEEFVMEDDDTAPAVIAPRPSTPPPSYLPLGPTLLRTHFHHAHLLPLCTPLRPPGMAVNNTPGNVAPMSVPTPVSPAAVLGAASEKSKSLEAAAQVLVKEVVENPVWSDAWRANASLSLTPPVLPGKIWQADARHIKEMLGGEPSVDLQTIFSGRSSNVQSAMALRTLESPTLVVGKGDSVIQLSPTSLRFWEKLGLSPRAGQKDVTAFVFYEGADEEREDEIVNWLNRVSTAYTAKNFGAHVSGMSSNHRKAGLVPTRFDTLRKTLMSFVSTIPTRNPHLVFYIATPTHIISSTSTTLRQILSAVRRFCKAHPDGDVSVHFVPESLILGTHTHPASTLGGLDTFVCSVYDRLLQPVSRAMSRKFFNLSAPAIGYFEAPAYALCSAPSGRSASHPKVTYSLESTVSSLDVTHRHTLLHVGYEVSACGRWVLAACIDAEGEAHDLKAWLTPDDRVEEFVASQVWTFVYGFSRRANIEWRIVISKLGLMAHLELDAWVSHLDATVSMSSEVPPMHVTLLAIDNDNPWTFLLPQEGNAFDILKRTSIPAPQNIAPKASRHTHTTFSDATCVTYSLQPSPDMTLYPAYSVDRSMKGASIHHVPGTSECLFVPDPEDEEPSNIATQPPTTEPVRVLGWSTVVCAPSTADYASLSSLRIFQLHVVNSLRSTYGISRGNSTAHQDAQGSTELMNDIVRNFHELAVLSRARWKLRADPALPFHLAALEVMRAALSGGAVDP